jgi:hypothetical protein
LACMGRQELGAVFKRVRVDADAPQRTLVVRVLFAISRFSTQDDPQSSMPKERRPIVWLLGLRAVIVIAVLWACETPTRSSEDHYTHKPSNYGSDLKYKVLSFIAV